MRFSTISLLAVVAVAADAAAPSGGARMPWALPRGGASSYASKLEAVKEKVLASTLPSVSIYHGLFCFGFGFEI
jgi:hypothetical protein